MPELRANLFGQCCVDVDGRVPGGLDSGKGQELLSYLVLFRDRPHSREALAAVLWGNQSTARSRKYLRQLLWQLQPALDGGSEESAERVLVVEPEWVRLNPKVHLVCDVASFEAASVATQGRPGHALDAAEAETLRRAVRLYRGDLLEGWYQDWCTYERERLQLMYLGMLDKLTAYCEARGDHETGIDYASQILRYDRAHERTHQRLMRLRYLAGDRAAALRQYQRCATALCEELDVAPSRRTLDLLEEIRSDAVGPLWEANPGGQGRNTTSVLSSTRPGVLVLLRQVQAMLDNIQRQLGSDSPAEEPTRVDSRSAARVPTGTVDARADAAPTLVETRRQTAPRRYGGCPPLTIDRSVRETGPADDRRHGVPSQARGGNRWTRPSSRSIPSSPRPGWRISRRSTDRRCSAVTSPPS